MLPLALQPALEGSSAATSSHQRSSNLQLGEERDCVWGSNAGCQRYSNLCDPFISSGVLRATDVWIFFVLSALRPRVTPTINSLEVFISRRSPKMCGSNNNISLLVCTITIFPSYQLFNAPTGVVFPGNYSCLSVHNHWPAKQCFSWNDLQTATVSLLCTGRNVWWNLTLSQIIIWNSWYWAEYRVTSLSFWRLVCLTLMKWLNSTTMKF